MQGRIRLQAFTIMNLLGKFLVEVETTVDLSATLA